MKWESKVANSMLSCMCLFKIPPSWIALPALLLLFASSQLVGFGFRSVVYTSLVVVLSTVIYTASNQKVAATDELVEEKVLSSVEESSDQREDVAPNPVPVDELVGVKVLSSEERSSDQRGDVAPTLTETKEEREVKDGPDHDLLSENEGQDHMSTSEESEVDWPFRCIVDQSPEYSDGSISDEESLIEIALPSGHYVGQQKEDHPKFNCSLQQKKELSAECLFSQHSLMEFLAEYNDMNEEDNLIEIDISMGSIKYSRFEIEA